MKLIKSLSTGHRGRQESRQLMWGDIKTGEDEHGKFLLFNERTTKTRTGESSNVRTHAPKAYANNDQPERCPVYLYNEYCKHRPLEMFDDDSPFYLAVNNTMKDPENPRSWYKRAALGANSLGNFMKSMASKAGIVGNFTNHSVRKTLCTNLLQAGVSPTLIQQVSGHKNVASISQYAAASKAQVKKMNEILNNPSENVPKLGDIAHVKSESKAARPTAIAADMQPNAKNDQAAERAKAAVAGMMHDNVLNNCTMNFSFTLPQ